MSLMMRQSALRCSLFDLVCSASSGPLGDVGSAGFSFATDSSFTFSAGGSFDTASACTVRILASSFRCRGVDTKTLLAGHLAASVIRRPTACVYGHVKACGLAAARRQSRLASIVSYCLCRDLRYRTSIVNTLVAMHVVDLVMRLRVPCVCNEMKF
jgi:hypothetical protein